MTNQLFTCSNGHRFSRNPKKHLDRNYVFCPRCKEKIVVHRRFSFTPNLTWLQQKQDRAEEKQIIKKMKRRPQPPFIMPHLNIPLLETLKAYVTAKQQKKETEK